MSEPQNNCSQTFLQPLVLRQVVDGRDEPEVGREELGGARQHQLVALLDRHVRHARDVRDLALGPLCSACLEISDRLNPGVQG